MNIDYIGVLDYLLNNQEIPYSNPDADGLSNERKTELLAIKEKGVKATNEMKKMVAECAQIYHLDKCVPINWLDGSHTKTKKYLWAQMKYDAFYNNPISISIFVERNGVNSTQYRISLELKNEGVNQATLNQYHSYLNKPIDFSDGL